MPGVAPLPPEEIENYEEFAARAIERMGFVVNSTKTMALFVPKNSSHRRGLL